MNDLVKALLAIGYRVEDVNEVLEDADGAKSVILCFDADLNLEDVKVS